MNEFDHQRDQHNSLIARNVEFSELIIDYHCKPRESSESLNAAGELSRKLTLKVDDGCVFDEILSYLPFSKVIDICSFKKQYWAIITGPNFVANWLQHNRRRRDSKVLIHRNMQGL